MKRLFTLLLLAAATLTACTEKEKTTPGGIRYTIHKKGTGPQLKLGDTIQLHVIIMNHKDSVVQSTYLTGMPEVSAVMKPQYASDPMTIFPELHEGDSLTVKVLADSIYKSDPRGIPPVFEKGKDIQFRFKVLNVLDAAELKKLHAEFEARRQQYMEQQKLAMEEGKRLMQESIVRDSAVIQKYLKENNLSNAKRTPDGVYYVITKKGTGPLPKPMERVSAHYKGSLLNGTVFDESTGKPPFDFTLGAHEVIPGWESGFAVLPEGSKATLIVPSHMAYGPQGSPPTIPGNSVLRFDVELVKISAGGPTHMPEPSH